METFVNGLANVIVYIDDLLVHSATHAEHITALDQVLQRLVQHNIKINLQKCFFGSKEVSYLGFHPPPMYTRYDSFWVCVISSDVMCGTSRKSQPRLPLLRKKSAPGKEALYLPMP
jgi:hypothetical protein